jgi:ERCC4-type nuclease
MDDRECRGPMPEALARCGGFELEIRRLEIGDYLLDGAMLIERKTLTDFVASIKDGRVFNQALRLAQAEQSAALVLEGTGSDLSGCGMRWEAIQGALITVSLFVGLAVLRSRSPAETARTMLYAARQHRAVTTGALPRHARRPKGKKALQNHILQGLPGIGPERAKRLLERFGSVGAVVAADAESLQSVAGIGPHTASRLVWSVEEPRASYGVRPAACLLESERRHDAFSQGT